MSHKGKRHKAGAAKADHKTVPSFDIDAEELDPAIVEAAMASGGYPHRKKMKREAYDTALTALQIELLKLETWVKDKGERIVVTFDGRDGAGKGGTIHRFTQHLNPRNARVVALAKPDARELGEWYFQRYVSRLPTRGEIVFFDRSWYNRAGVERVLGFTPPEAVERFLNEAPVFERILVRDGIRLIKIFLTIGREMQMVRLHARHHDPLKRWKLSPIDFRAIELFDDYSRAFEDMLRRTDTDEAPWTVVRANDKLRARLGAIRHVLSIVPYEGRDDGAIGTRDPDVALSANAFLAAGGEEEKDER